MAPILIDHRGLIKLGLISVFITVAVFVVGFFSGYQQASSFYLAGSETEILSLPAQDTLQESELEAHSPVAIVAGAEIDVDQPQLEQKKMATVKKLSAPAKNIIVAVKKVSSKKEVHSTTRQNQLDKVVLKDRSSSESLVDKKRSTVEVVKASPVELSDAKYSVQVGMYGSLINAENMVKMLQTQHFDAYVSGYTNDKNKSRFNVRFGYFIDKKSAVVALKRYKNNQKSDGYLVNFSVKNIVNLAGVNTTEQSTEQPIEQSVTTKKTLKKISSDMLSEKMLPRQAQPGKTLPVEAKSIELNVELTPENISQLDTDAILTVARTKALTDVRNNTNTK